jgi:Sigma-70, region 4
MQSLGAPVALGCSRSKTRTGRCRTSTGTRRTHLTPARSRSGELAEEEEYRFETVGRELGLTRERVHQLEGQALKQLETELADLAPVQTAAAGAAQAREAERVPGVRPPGRRRTELGVEGKH